MKKILTSLMALSCSAYAANNGYIKNGKSYLYVENENNVIECQVAQLCDIALVQGDLFKSWIMTDGTVWVDSVKNKSNYMDNNGVLHVVIQSTDLNSNNNVILVSSNNQYHFNLRSVNKSITNKYIFIEDAQIKLKNEQLDDGGLDIKDIESVDTKYYMKGDTSSDIAPIKAFNDGKKTYIEMPKDINTRQLPTVYSFTVQGRLEQTNFRYRAPYFVIDGLYPRIAIISGSPENPDEDALRVNIYRGDKPSGFKWLMQQYSE